MNKNPLPDEAILSSIDAQYPCREIQIRQLAHLFWPTLPSPPTVVIHGLEATGKTTVTRTLLETIQVSHAIIKCQECITARHLFERTVATVEDVLGDEGPATGIVSGSKRCESISTLTVQLQRLLEDKDEKFVLVFDDVDRQREVPGTLLPALARLGDIIPNLVVVLIVTVPRPRLLHRLGIPYVHFAPYSKDQALTILERHPQPIRHSTLDPPSTSESSDEYADDEIWLWTRFCDVVWDTLVKGAARDIVSFRSVCETLWPAFVAPVIEGQYSPGDFSRLLIAKRGIFQDESVLGDGVGVGMIVPRNDEEVRRTAGVMGSHDLPYFSKYLLCAAYLASYNPVRQDPIFFMKATEKKKRRKRGGGGKGGGTPGRAAKHRKIQRKLLGPQVFVLERLLAIFHAILPFEVSSSPADIYTQIATLSSLRLLLKVGLNTDPLEGTTKWRVNVSWDFVLPLARSVELDLEDCLAE